jgi:hypothetical protein
LRARFLSVDFTEWFMVTSAAASGKKGCEG